MNSRAIDRYLARSLVRKLQIGTGGHPLPGWLNTDRLPLRNKAVYLDGTRRFPLPDNSFDFAFSEHMIEHLSADQGRFMLTETHRVLKPGGVLRLSTPDISFLIGLLGAELSPVQRAYVDWASGAFLGEGQTPSALAVVNNYFRDWGHTNIYDKATLRNLMEGIGYTDIIERGISDSPHPELAGIDNDDRMPAGFLALESMIFEARKPG